LTLCLEKIVLSEKMIEEDLSQVEKSATKSTYRLCVGFERCENKGKKSAPKFIPNSNYHKEEEALKPNEIHYLSNPKPSLDPKRSVKKEIPKPREEALFACFVAVLVSWMSFASVVRELRRGALSMLETHIVMSSLIFRLILTLVLYLTHVLVICLISLMDIIIAHMVLVHKRITLCLVALVTTHALIIMIIPCVGMVFLLESLTPALSLDTWTIHVFPVMVLVPLVQRVRCKRS
jgi:hypothetical protein